MLTCYFAIFYFYCTFLLFLSFLASLQHILPFTTISSFPPRQCPKMHLTFIYNFLYLYSYISSNSIPQVSIWWSYLLVLHLFLTSILLRIIFSPATASLLQWFNLTIYLIFCHHEILYTTAFQIVYGYD